MKRLLFSIATFTLLLSSKADAQVFSQGNIGIDVYYGAPTLVQRLIKVGISDSSGADGIRVNSFGPIGIRGEYMVSDEFGIGLEFGVNRSNIEWDRKVVTYNNTTNQDETTIYQDRLLSQKFGGMVTFNYHFIDHDNFDLAGMFGIGYGRRSFIYSSSEPNINPDKFTFGTLWPIASRLGITMRYFFTDNIGINLGLGLGQGGLVNGGISAKF